MHCPKLEWNYSLRGQQSSSMAPQARKKNFLNAASGGNLNLLERLGEKLEKHAELKDEKGRTALHLASALGNTKICELLMNKFELDVDGRDDEGNTPLIVAIQENRSFAAVYLINNGADIMTCNDKAFTPLHYAAEKGNEEILELLISKGTTIDINSEAGTPLQCAALAGKKETLKILLDNKANPNSAVPFYSPHLMLSIVANSIECFLLLLKAGPNPNLGSYGKTSLILVACQGKTEIIKYLLKFEANPNVKDAISSFPDWSVAGIIKHISSKKGRKQSENRRRKYFHLAKSKGLDAFKRKEYKDAIIWFTEANLGDPCDASIVSNRSLCWALLKEGSFALTDAQMCVELKPDWPKAHYREGAAWMLLKNYPRATDAFNEALKLDPSNKEIQKAHREAVEVEFGFPVTENMILLSI